METDGSCYSARYRDDGDLLLGCRDEVKVLYREEMYISEEDSQYCGIISMAEPQGTLIVLHVINEEVRTVTSCGDPDEFPFEYPAGYSEPYSLDATDQYAVTVHAGTSELIRYDIESQESSNFHLKTTPAVVHIMANGDLLVLADLGINLTRYRLVDNQLTHFWTCDDVKDATTVCSDSDGYIYLCIAEAKMLYILSPDGKNELLYKLASVCIN